MLVNAGGDEGSMGTLGGPVGSAQWAWPPAVVKELSWVHGFPIYFLVVRSLRNLRSLSCKRVCPIASASLQPHRLLSARLLCPWNFPDKFTGVGCHSFSRGSSHPRD